MPWNGSGQYSRAYPSWSNDAANNLPISSTKFDTEDNDFAAGIQNCLCIDGQNSPTAPLVWTTAAAAVITLLRQTNGVGFSVGRSAGSNNPNLQTVVTDGTGVQLNLTTSQTLSMAIAGTDVLQVTNGGVVIIPTGVSAGLQITTVSTATAISLQGGSGFGCSIALRDGNSPNRLWQVGPALSLGTGIFEIRDGSRAATPFSINTTGTVAIAAPASGAWFQAANLNAGVGTAFTAGQTDLYTTGTNPVGLGTSGAAAASIWTNSTQRVTVSSTGAVTINAATGGTLTVNGPANAYGELVQGSATTGQSFGVQVSAGTNASDSALYLANAANSIGFLRVLGNQSILRNDAANTGVTFEVGYMDIPQVSMTANLGSALAHRGKQIYNTGASGLVYQLDTVAMPNTSAVTIINDSAGTMTITTASDVVVWSPTGATGTRTLAQFGEATAVKVTSGRWFLSGTGLS